MKPLLSFGLVSDAQALGGSFSDYVDTLVVTAAANAFITVPVSVAPNMVLITATSDIYISPSNTTPSAPVSTVSSGTGTGIGLIYIPGGIGRLFGIISTVTAIGFYSAAGATVTIEWFKLGQ